MKRISWRLALAQVLLGGSIVLAFFFTRGVQAGNQRIHLVTDWSHRHLIYSPPHSLMEQFRLSRNTRYVQQWLRRNAEQRNDWRRHTHGPADRIKGDWSVYMGAGATVGAGQYPAKYSFDVSSESCSDFVVYNTSIASPSVVAFTNLYAGGTCPSAPTVNWAYNTGGTAVTSVALSLDGSQVAFVQNVSGVAQLVVLKWAAGTGSIGSPVTPIMPLHITDFRSACAAPCMVKFPFSGGATDSKSSVFYDFDDDTAYVGDDSGFLHKFTGVFNGTPQEIVSSGSAVWPAQITAGSQILTGPIFADFISPPEVIVAADDGYLYRVDAAFGSGSGGFGVVQSEHLAASGEGIDDTPLVDGSGSGVVGGVTVPGLIYVFVRLDNGDSDFGGVQVPSVFNTSAGFEVGTVGLEARLGNDSTPAAGAMFSGNFDNLYWTTGTGNIYACGTNGPTATTLWQVGEVTNTQGMGGSAVGPTLASANVPCSSITEFFNPSDGTDRIFASVTDSASACAGGGCLFSYDVTSGTFGGSPATATVSGGASGVVVDNGNSATGASQVYFTPLMDQPCGIGGTGGCAIQASQSGLD